MPSPARFTAGVGTAPKGSVLWNYPYPDPTRATYEYFNDFDTYVSGDWTRTAIGTGTSALLADEPFGALANVNSAADNDGIQMQLTTENFTISTGKKAWFKARFKISDATESDFILGLCVLDSTLLGSVDGDGFTDGIYFSKEDGDTQLDFGCQKDTTTGQLRTTNIATVGTSYMTVGFEWDGVRYIKYFVDDVQKGTLDLTATSSAYMPDTPLTVSFGHLNGAAAAKTMTIDYVFAAIER